MIRGNGKLRQGEVPWNRPRPAGSTLCLSTMTRSRSAYRKGHGGLGGDFGFLFTGCNGDARTCGSAGSGSNQGTLAASGESANQRSRCSASADLGDVAFLMALAMEGMRGSGHRLAVHLGEPHGQNAGRVQASTGLRGSHAALRRISGFGKCLSTYDYIACDRAVNGLSRFCGA